MLASTTPAECIQERTASGSSFMLAVAPRGRLSWIPNISGALTLRLPPPDNHKNKTTREKEEEQKSSREKKAQLCRTDDEFFTNIENIESKTTETERKQEEDEGMREEEEKEERSEAGVLFFCRSLCLFFRFNSTFHSEQKKNLFQSFSFF